MKTLKVKIQAAQRFTFEDKTGIRLHGYIKDNKLCPFLVNLDIPITVSDSEVKAFADELNVVYKEGDAE